MAKTVRVKAHTTKDGKRVKAHTRNVKGASSQAGAGDELFLKHHAAIIKEKGYRPRNIVSAAQKRVEAELLGGRGGVIHRSTTSNKDKKARHTNGSGKSVRHAVDSNTTSKGAPKKHVAGRGGKKHGCSTSNNDKAQRMGPDKSKRAQKVAKYTKYMNALSKMRKK